MAEERRRVYQEITPTTREVVAQALLEDNVTALIRLVIAVSMYDPDWRFAQDLCVKLSSHPHANVRGNAVLGFGHIARVHRHLDQTIVQPIIRCALQDEDDYVRGHADSAVDDTAIFLKWDYSGNTP